MFWICTNSRDGELIFNYSYFVQLSLVESCFYSVFFLLPLCGEIKSTLENNQCVWCADLCANAFCKRTNGHPRLLIAVLRSRPARSWVMTVARLAVRQADDRACATVYSRGACFKDRCRLQIGFKLRADWALWRCKRNDRVNAQKTTQS